MDSTIGAILLAVRRACFDLVYQFSELARPIALFMSPTRFEGLGGGCTLQIAEIFLFGRTSDKRRRIEDLADGLWRRMIKRSRCRSELG